MTLILAIFAAATASLIVASALGVLRQRRHDLWARQWATQFAQLAPAFAMLGAAFEQMLPSIRQFREAVEALGEALKEGKSPNA